MNDTNGPIGTYLRSMLIPISSYYELQMNHDTYAMCTMPLCMQMMAFIQLPFILGPTFSSFLFIKSIEYNKSILYVLSRVIYKERRNNNNQGS